MQMCRIPKCIIINNKKTHYTQLFTPRQFLVGDIDLLLMEWPIELFYLLPYFDFDLAENIAV